MPLFFTQAVALALGGNHVEYHNICRSGVYNRRKEWKGRKRKGGVNYGIENEDRLFDSIMYPCPFPFVVLFLDDS